jgi:hypothetical protein
MINSGITCECAACNMKRWQERAGHDEAMKNFQEAIDRGDLDHLKRNTDSKDGQS